MNEIVKSLWRRFVSIFQRRRHLRQPIESRPRRPRRKAVSRTHSDEDYPGHAWVSADWRLRDLLSDLDATFEILGTKDHRATIGGIATADMRRAIRTMGPLVPGSGSWLSPENVQFHDVFGLPSFAGIVFPNAEDSDDWIACRAMYCLRAKHFPAQVAPVSGTPYEFGAVYPLDGKLWWRSFWGSIDNDGTPHLARQLCVVPHRFRTKHGWQTVRRKEWRFPDQEDGNAPERIKHLLSMCLSTWIAREFHWGIIVRKGDMRATFPIPQNDAPRFFRDREPLLVKSGLRRKPVFHAVAAHERRVNGRVTGVKMHYRGLRKFRWGDYRVHIQDPRHLSLTSATFGTERFDDDEPIPEGMMSLPVGMRKIMRAYD